jgi:hypothetical protein
MRTYTIKIYIWLHLLGTFICELYEFFEWSVRKAEILAMFLAETVSSSNVSLGPVDNCLFLYFPEDHNGVYRNRT